MERPHQPGSVECLDADWQQTGCGCGLPGVWRMPKTEVAAGVPSSLALCRNDRRPFGFTDLLSSHHISEARRSAMSYHLMEACGCQITLSNPGATVYGVKIR